MAISSQAAPFAALSIAGPQAAQQTGQQGRELNPTSWAEAAEREILAAVEEIPTKMKMVIPEKGEEAGTVMMTTMFLSRGTRSRPTIFSSAAFHARVAW